MITSENHAEMMAARALKHQRGKEIIFNRSNLIKEIFSRPLSDLTAMSKEFKKIMENKFNNLDELTVFEAVQISTVMKYLVKGDPKDYQNLTENAFGKVKEEEDKRTIEIPVFEDPLTILKQLDKASLQTLINSISQPESIEIKQISK
jgi:hypothetical protein